VVINGMHKRENENYDIVTPQRKSCDFSMAYHIYANLSSNRSDWKEKMFDSLKIFNFGNSLSLVLPAHNIMTILIK
jgi:hypothetical protein